MVENRVDIENFLLFVAALFPPGDCIPPLPTNLTKVFEAITHHGLWDSFHYSPLVRIIRKFGAGDREMEAWIQDYQKDLRSYTLLTTVEDCELVTSAEPPPAERAKYDPRYCRPVEWKTDFDDHTLHYLTDVWELFSDRYLLPDSPPTALLDRIRRGCNRVMGEVVYEEEVAGETIEVSSVCPNMLTRSCIVPHSVMIFSLRIHVTTVLWWLVILDLTFCMPPVYIMTEIEDRGV